MICPKCNAQLPEGAKFCGSCGNKLVEENIDSASRRNFLSNIKEFLMPLRAYAIPLSLIVFILILIIASPKTKIQDYFESEYIANAVQKELGKEKVPRSILDELETLNLYDYSNEDLSELSKLDHLKTLKINSCLEKNVKIKLNGVRNIEVTSCDIETLDLSQCTATNINCSNNNLRQLILPNDTEHTNHYLDCSNNQLDWVNITNFAIEEKNLITANADGKETKIIGSFFDLKQDQIEVENAQKNSTGDTRKKVKRFMSRSEVREILGDPVGSPRYVNGYILEYYYNPNGVLVPLYFDSQFGLMNVD